ncbi:MAG TPA: hypothetical protein PLA24_06860 [Tenuifilaceae bacterium]|nr:hypothetical protein [Tenuifilaceae bacterium]
MGKTVSIEIIQNGQSQSIKDFLSSFQNDIKHCLNRFNIESNFTDDESKTDYRFLIISSESSSNKKVLESIENNADNYSRTFLLILEPDKNANDSANYHKFLTYRFWDQISETGEIRMYRRNTKETQALYWERITDIAIELSERINQTTNKKGKIFLAQTDISQLDDRDNIKRDLNDLGYEVVPDKQLSNNTGEASEQLNQAINSCDLIIHLIPSTYAKYFTENNLSVIEFQFNYTVNHSIQTSNSIKRLVWIPSDIEFYDEESQIFVEKIQRDKDQAKNTMVLKVNLEDLKKIYRKILSGEGLNTPASQELLPDVYVISDKEPNAVAHSVDSSSKNKLKVGANYDGISYSQHLKCLANAQVVVINYSSENKQWINVKIHDILKSPGLETSKPNKRLILIKNQEKLDTSYFEQYFNEVHVVDANDIKLNL